MRDEQPEHVKRVAWEVDTLVADEAHLRRFRERLEQSARNVAAEDEESRWSFKEPGLLDLADRYTLLAAVHDGVCAPHSQKIMPPEWWPADRAKPPHALHYVLLEFSSAPHLKGEWELQAFLDQVKADLRRKGAGSKTDRRNVQADLLRLCEQGEPYTSQGKLAKRLNCSTTTVNKALNGIPKLKAWMGQHAKQSLKAGSLNDVVTDNTPSKPDDPADVLPDDDVDTEMRRLIEQAGTPENRAQLNSLTREERRDLVKLAQKQNYDQVIQDRAKKGNRILGRKP